MPTVFFIGAYRFFFIAKKGGEPAQSMSKKAIKLPNEPLAVDVSVDEPMLRVCLVDGREIAAPLEWFPRLRDATPEQRANWRLIGGEEGIHWTDMTKLFLCFDCLVCLIKRRNYAYNQYEYPHG